MQFLVAFFHGFSRLFELRDGLSVSGGTLNFWDASLEETVRRAGSLARNRPASRDVVDWLSLYDEDSPTSSNQGASRLPFQRWFRFKEAFSPKFVADTIAALPYKVNRVLDPFAGSGTTGLTCGFLGINSISLEVNPFLADLIAAKVTPIRPSSLLRAYERVRVALRVTPADKELPDGMPVTLREPGVGGRWVFDADMFDTIRSLVRAMKRAPQNERRLLRVLLGSVLVQNSNVVINGKGRRYRSGWQLRERTVRDLLDDLDHAVDASVADLTRFSVPVRTTHQVSCGDSRALLQEINHADLAIFSPPYPNSFDYTDVYNLELWMLGYLRNSKGNRRLRLSTMRSHVQVAWDVAEGVCDSPTLKAVLRKLHRSRHELWNPRIPEMVSSYFDDMRCVLVQLARILPAGRHAVCAIGDSQYAGILIDVAKIVGEIAESAGFRIVKSDAIRSMRTSSQHGGLFDLREHCLVMKRN